MLTGPEYRTPAPRHSPDGQPSAGLFGGFSTLAELVSDRDHWRREAREARYDSLTGLRNLKGWQEDMREQRACEGPSGVLVLDVDGFKRVNDTYGHAAGNALMRDIGVFLQACFRTEDGLLAARMGGDEFCVGVPDLQDRPDSPYAFMDLMYAYTKEMTGLFIANRPGWVRNLGVSFSVGVAASLEPRHVSLLLDQADDSMYEEKPHSRGAPLGPPAGMEAGCDVCQAAPWQSPQPGPATGPPIIPRPRTGPDARLG